ncbi:MAG: glycosyltransferase family 4 protein [bacterium]|nr:glycosyltransferase family 4 protein [bacterium]
MTHASQELPVCILVNQYFGFGKIGGFGSMARRLAEALAARGAEVSVIAPASGELTGETLLNGVNVQTFPPTSLPKAIKLIKGSTARIFHSQEPSLLTALAQFVRPDAAHIVTCRDPRDTRDWWTEFRDASVRRKCKIPLNYALEGSILVTRAVRRSHGVYVPADFLKDKVRRMYRPRADVQFLPNLIHVPAEMPPKANPPTLTYIGRLDGRKRPRLFLDLARVFPECRFLVVGRAENADEDQALRAEYAGLPNVEWVGYIDRFADPARMEDVLARTCILVNTSSREGLPMTFLEAGAYGSAILSAVDPDGFATRFGVHVEEDRFADALRSMLAGPDDPKAMGLRARAYVQERYEWDKALDHHIACYRAHLNSI